MQVLDAFEHLAENWFTVLLTDCTVALQVDAQIDPRDVFKHLVDFILELILEEVDGSDHIGMVKLLQNVVFALVGRQLLLVVVDDHLDGEDLLART